MTSTLVSPLAVADRECVATVYRPAHPRLLVVHDQVAVIQLLYHALGHGHQLFMAATGGQALVMCLQHAPDLVLLNVAMPDASGIDICRQLSTDERTAHIPVVLLTDGEDVLQQVSGIQAGAAECLAQPINPVLARLRVDAQLALHYQARLLNDRLEHDAASGVGNRKRFDRQLATEWRRAVRNGEPLTLLLLTVEALPPSADAPDSGVVRPVAEGLSRRLQRPADMVSYWGHNQFACLLPNTPWVHGMALARELAATVDQVLRDDPQRPVVEGAAPAVCVGVAVRTSESQGSMAGLLALAQARQADACQYPGGHVCGVVLP